MPRPKREPELPTPARAADNLLADWLAACEEEDRRPLLRTLSLGPRLLRLFAVACCDDIISLMKDKRSVRAVRVAELFADGFSSEEERRHAADAAYAYASAAASAAAYADAAASAAAYADAAAAYADAAAAYAADAAYAAAAYASAAAYAAASAAAYAAAAAAAAYAYADAAADDAADDAARNKKHLLQGRILIAIVGPGWSFDPAWRTSTATIIARRIYDAKEWHFCPILADSLQDAGCDESAILDYLRGDEMKFRGCRVLDELIGKRDS